MKEKQNTNATPTETKQGTYSREADAAAIKKLHGYTTTEEQLARTETGKAQHSPEWPLQRELQYPRGPWTLHKLYEDDKWSAGVNGPRVYLQCDELTAKLIVASVNHADKLAEALREILNAIEAGIPRSEPDIFDAVILGAEAQLEAYEAAQ